MKKPYTTPTLHRIGNGANFGMPGERYVAVAVRNETPWREKLRDWWRVLRTPLTWIRHYPYSAEWDALLRQLMEENSFEECGPYTAKLGNVEMWVANHPYASFHTYPYSRVACVMPRRITVLKAGDKYRREKPSSIPLMKKEYENWKRRQVHDSAKKVN